MADNYKENSYDGKRIKEEMEEKKRRKLRNRKRKRNKDYIKRKKG